MLLLITVRPQVSSQTRINTEPAKKSRKVIDGSAVLPGVIEEEWNETAPRLALSDPPAATMSGLGGTLGMAPGGPSGRPN